jgi:uncharacterized protein
MSQITRTRRRCNVGAEPTCGGLRSLALSVSLLAILPILAGCGSPDVDAQPLQAVPLPILDMHLHAMGAADQGPPPVALCTPMTEIPVWDPAEPAPTQWLHFLKNPPCDDPVWSPLTDQELMERTLAVLERRNAYGVLSGGPERVARWMEAAPGRFIAGAYLGGGPGGGLTPDLGTLEAMYAAGAFQVLGEVTTQYAGILPTDPLLDPYWAFAEAHDIPVGIHVGTGPPGVIYLGAGGYRGYMHSALTMEEVLVKYPRLRVYLAHAGFPLLDDLLTLLYAHPQVHVDVGVIAMALPRAGFHRFLEGIVAGGFVKRVMFGSDQMVWPEGIDAAIEAIETAPFLSEAQKRDILYHNAARFLRLSDEEIARHHQGVVTR